MLRAAPVWLFVAALLAGALQALSIAAPWSGQPLWWLQMLSLAALVWLLQQSSSVKQAALLGWCFALAWLCGTFWWLFISMHTYGGLPAVLAVLAILALAGFLALYYAAAAAFFKAFGAVAVVKPAWQAIIFAACWMLAELARNSWFTGFPWGAGGYAHVDGPLGYLAPLVGVYGIGFVASVLLVWVLCAAQIRGPWQLGAALATVLVVGAGIAIGAFVRADDLSVTQPHPTPPNWVKNPDRSRLQPTRIALLQGNIAQGEKFDSTKGVPQALAWYADELMRSTATLVVGPETAIPLLPSQLPPDYWQPLQARFAAGNTAALVGIPLGSFDAGYTNSVVGLQPGSSDATRGYQYHKHHLVPFGEFIPPLFKWFTRMMNIPLGDFNRGAVGQRSFEWANQRWAPNICYEDLFGDELAARFADKHAAPTVMVNLSNIAWFGNSVAIDQHLHISRMRALELARPMVRATNTGATVIINHRGEVTHNLPRYTQGVLQGAVEGRSGTTPFAWWAARLGLWPLWVLGVAVLVVGFVAHRYRRVPVAD